MTNRSIQLQLGGGACVVSLFLILIAIPSWVSAPSNVPNVILSPFFWPYALAGCTGLVGVALIAASFRLADDLEPVDYPTEDARGAWIRLLTVAFIMAGTMFLLPRLGMVWTCMLSFAATAFLVKTRHPVAAIISAIAVPLILYAFFAHVAGVAVPQGNYVRLP